MDNKGYVMGLVSFLLIIPTFLILMVFVNMTVGHDSVDKSDITSDDVLFVAKDMETNLPLIGREVLKNKSEKVVESGNPLSNSQKEIKDDIQHNMDILCSKYSSGDVKAKCEVMYVNNSQDPFQIEIKSKINVEKGTFKHQVNLTQNISIINGSYLIMDPVPFVKCKEHGGVTIQNGKIFYGSSLANYLESRGINNSEAYKNATSPLYINKCPYDPYELHGNNHDLINLKNCLDNGFYHESSDGACFLCRLEGKGVCSHYGMETFIVPAPAHNSSNLSISDTAPSSSDHVIFNDTGHGTYSGKEIIFFNNGNKSCRLFLDNSHRKKYGLPIFT